MMFFNAGIYRLNLAAAAAGFVMDFFLGDPEGLYHPVCLIGGFISVCEKALRRVFPDRDGALLAAGGAMAAAVVLFSAILPLAILGLCLAVSRWLYFAACCVMSWQIVAAGCLKKEAEGVRRAFESEGLERARIRVGRLVGRDTASLSAAQVIKAAVETVAENTTDGVTAPLFYLIIGGPVLGFVYKAISTMDSMVGYKNDRYLYFGRCAARLDDAANYIPSRLTGLAMALCAPLAGLDGRNAMRIRKRDRRNHASPNSAQTESACAGALHLRLAGDAYYFGKLVKKPFIGDDDREAESADISRACRLMYVTSAVLLLAYEAAGIAVSFLL